MFNVQAHRFEETSAELKTNEIISKLIKSKAVSLKDPQLNTSNSLQSTPNASFRHEISLSQKTVILKPSTKLQVEMLGKSSFKSGIDFNRSKIVCAELEMAQRSLVLLDYFHLLFIVTPFDEQNPPPMPDRIVFYNKVRLVETINLLLGQPSFWLKLITRFWQFTVHSAQPKGYASSKCNWYFRIDGWQIDVRKITQG